ncbi:MAG: putative toxin-antitoxin system toxin component, PIN family [Armatimonadota bacterium]
MRVVIDTNVWVSAFLTPHGAAAQVARAFREGRIESVVSEPILQEVRAVLLRPRIQRKYPITEAQVDEYLRLIREQSLVVELLGVLQRCRDPRDNFLLETAVLGNAECIVTRDDDLKRDIDLMTTMQRLGVEILSVRQLLERLSE